MIEWILFVLSIGGNVLVIRKRREGFACWITANIGWLGIACDEGTWARAAMWSIYLALAVWGFMSWRKKL